MSISVGMAFPLSALARRETPAGAWRFGSLLAVLAAFFLRVDELIPALNGMQIYLGVIIPAFILNRHQLIDALRPATLRRRPLCLMVLIFWAVGLISYRIAGPLDEDFMATQTAITAAGSPEQFTKVMLLFFLVVAVVNTPWRLRITLMWIGGLVAIMCILPIMDQLRWIDHPAFSSLTDRTLDPNTGQLVKFTRLRGIGSFNDPNDMCQIAAVAAIFALYGLQQTKQWLYRGLWLGAGAILLYAMVLTQSRGGFLSLVAGLGVLGLTRYGWKKTLMASVVAVPAALLVFGGRQTDISADSGTGQSRIQLWADAFACVRAHPILGVGPDHLFTYIGMVAHNSYLHAFAETGLLGGAMFLALPLLGMLELHRRRRLANPDPMLAQARPYLLAGLGAYAMGMFSLTRCYELPTYLLLGLTQAMLLMTPGQTLNRFDKVLVKRVAMGALGFLFLMYWLIRLTVRWS